MKKNLLFVLDVMHRVLHIAHSALMIYLAYRGLQ